MSTSDDTTKQASDIQVASNDHLVEQLKSVLHNLLNHVPSATDLVKALDANPDRHEDFKQSPEATAKELAGMEVPEGTRLTHDPKENAVSLTSQIPISNPTAQFGTGQNINTNLTVNINNTINIVLGIPGQADVIKSAPNLVA